MAAVRGKHHTAVVTLAMQQWLNSMSIIKRHGFALLKTLLGQNIICFHILAKNHHGNKRNGLFKNCFNYHDKSDPTTTTKISSKTPPIQKQTTTIQPSSTEPPHQTTIKQTQPNRHQTLKHALMLVIEVFGPQTWPREAMNAQCLLFIERAIYWARNVVKQIMHTSKTSVRRIGEKKQSLSDSLSDLTLWFLWQSPARSLATGFKRHQCEALSGDGQEKTSGINFNSPHFEL